MKLTHDELLILLIEECGEVIQAATKCLRFGFNVDHGTGYGNNRDQLSKELGGVNRIGTELDLSGSAYLEGWRHKIERAEAAKEKYGHAPASSTSRGVQPCDPNDLRPIWEQGLALPSKLR